MRTEFRITGMHCGSCAALIKEELEEMPGINLVDVTFDAGHAVVEFEENVIRPEAIVTTIEQIGYHATQINQ